MTTITNYTIIPVNNKLSNQSFDVVLAGNEYTIELLYNTRLDRWIFSMLDKNNSYIFQGLTLLLGIDYAKIITDSRLPNGQLIVGNNANQSEEPNADNLGVTCNLIFIEA